MYLYILIAGQIRILNMSSFLSTRSSAPVYRALTYSAGHLRASNRHLLSTQSMVKSESPNPSQSKDTPNFIFSGTTTGRLGAIQRDGLAGKVFVTSNFDVAVKFAELKSMSDANNLSLPHDMAKNNAPVIMVLNIPSERLQKCDLFGELFFYSNNEAFGQDIRLKDTVSDFKSEKADRYREHSANTLRSLFVIGALVTTVPLTAIFVIDAIASYLK